MKNFRYIVLFLFAGIRIVSPLWQALWFGYDSVGLFLWELGSGLAAAYLCRLLAECMKRLEILEKQNTNDT